MTGRLLGLLRLGTERTFPQSIITTITRIQRIYLIFRSRVFPLQIRHIPMKNPQSSPLIVQHDTFHNEQQRQVLQILRENPGGLTREQISLASGLKLQSVCGRCRELMESGAIENKTLETDEDRYEVLLTAGGRTAAVLVVT